jgi:hypothetical protein
MPTLLLISVNIFPQDLSKIEYGEVEELNGVRRIFITTKADKNKRDEIAAYIRNKLPEIIVTGSMDDAEVILIYDSSYSFGAGIVYKTTMQGKIRILMDWKGSKGYVVGRDLEKKFANEFADAYRKANRNKSKDEIVAENPYENVGEPVDDNWIKVNEDENSKMYYNPHDVIETGRTVKVWLVIVFRGNAKVNYIEKRRESGYSIKDYNRYVYTMNLQEYDCVERKVRQLSAVDYDRNRRVLGNSRNEDATNWEHVIPDSIGRDIFDRICINRK